MNISKFTQKSLQAVQDLEKTAYEFGNQEIEQEHLLYNLLHQDDSLILKMIEKMEIQKEHFLNRINEGAERQSQGTGRESLHRPVSEQGSGQRGGRSQGHGGRVCLRGAPVFVHAGGIQAPA